MKWSTKPQCKHFLYSKGNLTHPPQGRSCLRVTEQMYIYVCVSFTITFLHLQEVEAA